MNQAEVFFYGSNHPRSSARCSPGMKGLGIAVAKGQYHLTGRQVLVWGKGVDDCGEEE